MARSKHHGRYYTEGYLVRNILDFGEYFGNKILKKHVIDNSCGDGAFLKEITTRYCEAFVEHTSDIAGLKTDLETYIHGIEIDKTETEKCISNLDLIAKEYGVENVQWDIINADTLTIDKFNKKMDYVFGNPPYVRVHNLKDRYSSVKKFSFAKTGMTDMYVVFFEIGFNMLNEDGKMCLITPSSWLNSKAGYELRKYVYTRKNLIGVIDMEHFQAFEATTYTIISLFSKEENDEIEYNTYDSERKKKTKHATLTYSDILINNAFYFAKRDILEKLRKILESKHRKTYVKVKNGFATLCDSVFISDFNFNSDYVIDVIKASTGVWHKCIFPYDEHGVPITIEQVEQDKPLFNYLNKNKDKLLKGRDIKDPNEWYLFGRTQAIKDVSLPKISINVLFKDSTSLKISKIDSGKGVFSGLYILTQEKYSLINKIMKSDDFIEYIKALRKYKSGGYYTFSSKELELFLNYKISIYHGRQPISESNYRLF